MNRAILNLLSETSPSEEIALHRLRLDSVNDTREHSLTTIDLLLHALAHPTTAYSALINPFGALICFAKALRVRKCDVVDIYPLRFQPLKHVWFFFTSQGLHHIPRLAIYIAKLSALVHSGRLR